MKHLKFYLSFLLVLAFGSCKKDSSVQQIMAVPNGDFELWDSDLNLISWRTNSCPACLPPYDTYVVKKVTDAYSGQFSAKFIYNNVYQSFANNKFAISDHPSNLTVYIKSNITSGDTATIHVDLFAGANIVDSGNFYETTSTANYKKIDIPISQTSSVADSATIKIVGGKKQNTELYIDDMVLIKN